MSPKDVVKTWVEAFNRADVDALAALYAEGAVNHQVAEEPILEWRDPRGLRGSGSFHVRDSLIQFQRGYWDKLSFLRLYELPLPSR